MIGRLGKYEIHSEIGRGAFGRVFCAYDPQTRRNVAIKVLIADSDPELLGRFRAEAEATGNLNHKNIVTVYDYGEYEGKPYIVMELLDGENLQQIISHGAQLPLLDKVRIILQAAEGLAYAHDHKVVHRDIKRANLMVLRDNNVKIMDFGIARVTGDAETRRTRQGDLIGTMLYMSPERIHGADADACADIFSFGVVCYEFLTGKHPFEGSDYAAVIYSITSVEPLSLRHFIPECPEALELVIQRAIAKDPELRYQSMEEILFDLRPALLELAQLQSASLMQEAQELMDSGGISEAQEKVRKVLKLDPTNQQARRVHESLIKDQRKRAVRARVESLVQNGQTQFVQRHFTQAIQCFESALRLDSSDTEAQNLLDQAKAVLEASRKASRLLSEARHEMLAGNLEAAYASATEALSADPQSRDAASLGEKIKQQIEERDRRIRLESAFHRATELRAQKDFAGARSVLAEIAHEAEADALADMRSHIDADEAESLQRAREMRMQEGISKARQQIQANQLAAAEETLHSLLEEFPDSTDAGRLLGIIREQLEAHRRAETVNKLTEEANRLLQAEQFLDACLLLGEGLQEYPNDFAIQLLLDKAVALQREHDRAKVIARALEDAHQLQIAGRLDDALSLVDSALVKSGHDNALADFKRQLKFELEQQQYILRLGNALAAGRELLDQRRFSEAVTALEASTAEYPGEPELASLLNSARQGKALEEEQQFVDETGARFQQLEQSEDWQGALDCIEEAVKRYPYNANLFGMAARARENWRQRQRQEHITRSRGTVKEAIAAGDWTRADQALREARQHLPGETLFDDLAEEIRQGQLQEQLRTLADHVRQSFDRNDLDGVARQLAAAQALSHQPLWQTLQEELDRRRTYQDTLQRARQLEARGDYPAAEKLLDQVLQNNPPDHEAAALANTLRNKRAAKERDEAIAREIQSIEGYLRDQNFSEAANLADRLGRQFQSDPRIVQVRSRIKTEQLRAEREQAYQQALEAAEQLRATGNYEKAEQALREAVREPLDSRAASLLDTVVYERSQRDRQRQLEEGKREARASLDRRDFAGAFSTLDGLQRDFSDDAELVQIRAAAKQQQAVADALAWIDILELRKQLDSALELALKTLQQAPQHAELLKVIERLREQSHQAALDQLAETVHGCLDANELERAVEALETARQQIGQEPLWQTLHVEVEQRLAHESVLRQAEQCIQQGDYAQAEQLLRGALERRADSRASALLAVVTAELAQERRLQAIHEGRRHVNALMDKGDFAGALAVTEQLLAEYTNDAGLEQCRQAVLQRIEIAFVSETLVRIAELQKQQQWDRALAEAEESAARYPGNIELKAALERVRNIALQEQRRKEIARLAQEIQRTIETRHWAEAEELLQAAQKRFSGEKIFDHLGESLRKVRRQEDLDALGSSVARCFSEGNLDEAERQIASHKAAFHEDAIWQSLNRQLEFRRSHNEALSEAEELRRERDYEGAEALLRQLIAKGVPDTRAAILLQAITAERSQRQHDAAVLEARQEADRLVRNGSLAEALDVLNRIHLEYPESAEIAQQRTDLEHRLQQQSQPSSTSVAEPPRPRARRKLWIVTVALSSSILVALAILAAIYRTRSPQPIEKPPQTVPSQIAPPPLSPTLATPTGEMVLVPAGSFLFGEHLQPVTLPAFYIDRTEVTNGAFQAFCQDTGHPLPAKFQRNQPEYPVVNITIDEARQFAQWAGKRLPTSQEWEKAARGTEGLKFPWGNEQDPTRANVKDNKSLRKNRIMPADAFQNGASPFHALQMVGNVWEFVEDAGKPNDEEIARWNEGLASPLRPGEPWYMIRGGSHNEKLDPAVMFDSSSVPVRI